MKERRTPDSKPKKVTMFQRMDRIFLWIAPFLAVFVGQTRNLAGVVALLAGYAVFVALAAAVVWKIGATKTGSGVVREHPAFLPGVLLLSGPLALFLGASVTGEPTAARPGDYLLNTTAILLGSVILVVGFVTLFAGLWRAGQRLLPLLGLVGLLIGAAVWLANLVFRYAVVASGAAELQAAVEDRAWVANQYLRGLRGEPSWMEFLLVWTDVLQLAFVLIAFLVAAAFTAALVGVGWLGRVGGGIFVGINLALALAVTLGIVLAGGGSVAAAWTAYILTVPFMAFILPYFVGVALVRRGGRVERTVAAATESYVR
jgi:hypothetical protein